MRKVFSFFKRPRNMYFSIVVMFSLVMGLVSVSFSYYVPDTSVSGVAKLKRVDNRIQANELNDGYIVVGPHETKNVSLYVMSNNDFKSQYKIFYKTDGNVKVLSEMEAGGVIDAHGVLVHELMVANFEDVSTDVYIGIDSSYLDTEIFLSGEKVELLEN